jgi:hypothetical protein
VTHLVQLQSAEARRVALVDEPRLRLLRDVRSVYELAQQALATGQAIRALIDALVTDEALEYDPVHEGASEWKLLSPIDHPEEPARCLVSGTGLTHMGSANQRQAMHEAKDADLTDSMKMFRLGLEGGRPRPGDIGVAPEWFYKGNGTILRAHGEPLLRPNYAEDGGEEAEIAGVYVIAPDGRPVRIGMCAGNEFSDHRFERRNYLNLASSKLRTCSLGPELVIDPEFASVQGIVAIDRRGETIWSKEICTGEAEMCHSLANIEHHHFKYDAHRRPGDVHVHYFGACALSFGDGIGLVDGDVMQVRFAGFGRPLRNPLRIDDAPSTLVAVKSLA